MDNYYIWADYVKKNNLTFDEPKALDLELFRNDLEKLKNGETIFSPIYDFKTGERTDTFKKIESNINYYCRMTFCFRKKYFKNLRL